MKFYDYTNATLVRKVCRFPLFSIYLPEDICNL